MTRRNHGGADEGPQVPGVAEDLHQGKPFHSLGQEVLLSLLRTADAVKGRLTSLLASADVTFQQYNVLRILRGAEPDGLPTLDIATRMVERTPGVTRIVDRLERKGWVSRTRDTEDRRRVFCRITSSGLELLESLDEPVNRTDSSIFARVDEADLRELVALLDELRACVNGQAAEGV